jgi:hypothetical protein
VKRQEERGGLEVKKRFAAKTHKQKKGKPPNKTGKTKREF